MNSPASDERIPAAASGRSVASAAGMVAVFGLAAYADSLSGPFLFDDREAVLDNPTIRHLSSALFPPSGGTAVSGRPLANLSFAINYAVGGTHPWSYHALNLLLHIAAGLTLFGIVRRTLSHREAWAGSATALAFCSAVIWTVHPLVTEAVAYVSQRTEVLMGLLYLLTLYCFIRGTEAGDDVVAGVGDPGMPASAGPATDDPGSRSHRGRPQWFALSVLACLLGMAAKEVMVTAPVMVYLYDATFVSGSFGEAWRRRKGYYGALAGTWVLLAALVIGSGSRGGTAGFSSGVPWWGYALTQFRAVAIYLKLALWPHPLIADYGRMLGGPPVEVMADAVLVLALVAATVVLVLRRSPLGFLGAWFFGILAPSSSVIPVATEIIAERRAYLSLAAVVAGGVLVIHAVSEWALDVFAGLRPVPSAPAPRLLRSRGKNLAGFFLCLVIASGFAGLTAFRNDVYGSALAFWSDVAAKVPDNPGAWNNLGNIAADRGAQAEAIADYEHSLSLNPEYSDAHANLGHVLLTQGRLQDAITNYRVALKYRPKDPEFRKGMGVACYRLGNSLAANGQSGPAADAYRDAVEMQPDFADARVNYGGVLAELGRRDEAVAQFEAAARLDPAAPDVHNDLGGLLAESGRLTEARAQLEEALRLRPDYKQARDNLDRVNRMLGAAPSP